MFPAGDIFVGTPRELDDCWRWPWRFVHVNGLNHALVGQVDNGPEMLRVALWWKESFIVVRVLRVGSVRVYFTGQTDAGAITLPGWLAMSSTSAS
jgi:hypothetical protein